MHTAIAWFTKNPVAANLLMTGIVLAGVLGYALGTVLGTLVFRFWGGLL